MKIYREVKVTDRLPLIEEFYYTSRGYLIFSLARGQFESPYLGYKQVNVENWLEEIELPSEKDLIGMAHYYDTFESEGDDLFNAYKQGANYIINKLKGV